MMQLLRVEHTARLCAALLLAACARPPVGTALAPLTTDRPSFSTGTGVVPVGFPQVESGASFATTDGVDVITVGEATLRAGITPTIEVRLTAPSYLSLRSSALTADGYGDAAIGAKIVLDAGGSEPGFGAPAISLLVGSTLPTGSEAFGNSRGLLSSGLLVDWTLAPRVGLNANAVWGQTQTASGTADTWAGVLGLSFTHDDRVGSFVQVFSVRDASASWEDPFLIGGVTLLARPTLQLDVHGGVRMSDPGMAHYVGIGLSRRF